MFAREPSEALTSLVKKIDRAMQGAVGKTPRPLGAYVIFLKDAPDLDKDLRALADAESIKQVPLGIGVPPPGYSVSPDADLTVAVYSAARRHLQRVTANFALRKGELTEAKIEAIATAVAAVLPAELAAIPIVPTSREQPQEWRYTLDKPASHWFKPDFNDLAWKTGQAGFGNKGTPNAIDRTPWHTEEIWLRRGFVMPDRGFNRLLLQIHADDYADVYINGVLAVQVTKCTPTYQEFAISEEALKTLRPGPNVLAVTCRDSGGGRSIDVGIVETKR